jgi:hypothetical protein
MSGDAKDEQRSLQCRETLLPIHRYRNPQGEHDIRRCTLCSKYCSSMSYSRKAFSIQQTGSADPSHRTRIAGRDDANKQEWGHEDTTRYV